MAEEKKIALEREYIIPLRREWLKVEEYRRAGRAAKAVKKFIAKHMKVAERDTDKVKLDIYLNNELWCRGKRSPPSKIKVKAVKETVDGVEFVKVTLAEVPQHLTFLKAKHEKRHMEADKKPEKTAEKKENVEEKKETAEEKKSEVEKEKAGEDKQIKDAKKEKKTQQHAVKDKKVEIHRTSMNRH